MSPSDSPGRAARLRAAAPDWLRPYLPSKQERGRYTGPFSTFAEYHALAVGFALGPRFAEVAAAYGTSHGAGKCRRSGHLTDAWKELAYAGLGVGLRVATGAV